MLLTTSSVFSAVAKIFHTSSDRMLSAQKAEVFRRRLIRHRSSIQLRYVENIESGADCWRHTGGGRWGVVGVGEGVG